MPRHIGVISSTQAAGYADFVKILNERWGGLQVDVAHVQVQGEAAPNQIIDAIKYFNETEQPPEILVIIRGGGSADDLSAFNDEPLVRAIASSRIPTLVGVGHEVDVTLADLAADVRAATPSNAAQIVVPERQEIIQATQHHLSRIAARTEANIDILTQETRRMLTRGLDAVDLQISNRTKQVSQHRQMLAAYDPGAVLARGYAILRGEIAVGGEIEIEQAKKLIKAEVKNVTAK